MNNPRKKKQLMILVGLLIVLIVVLYRVLDGSLPPDFPKVGTMTTLASSDDLDGYVLKIGRGEGRREQKLVPISEISPVIHFRKLDQIEAVEPSFSRNMFSFYTPRPNRKSRRMSRQPVLKASESIVVGKKSEDLIKLKFYGFKMDKKGTQLLGFFADGDSIFLAQEGDLVANRYRIHRITNKAAEVEEVRSKVRKQLHLIVQ